MGNTDLWKEVERTDPAAVKPITGKQYQGNSPKPYWLIKRATEVFGPIGIGWGCVVKSERFERIGDSDVLHVAVVSVWYVRDGKRSETFDQMGGTKAAYRTGSGKLLVDEDAGKKSVTDGMVKCLSMIGFAGDIFSGRWDDSKYVEEVGREFAEERRREERPSLVAYMTAAQRAIEGMQTRDDLVAWWDKEAPSREFVGIDHGSDDWRTLRDAWTKKGKSFAASKVVDRSAVAA